MTMIKADPAIATEHSITLQQKAEIEARLATSIHAGAHIADYLSMAVDHDEYLEQIEPFFDDCGESAIIDICDYGADRNDALTYWRYAATLYAALGRVLDEDEELNVTDLAIRSWCCAKGFEYALGLVQEARR